MSARLQPFQHQCLLFGSWINSVRVVHGKHPLILAQGMTGDKTWPKINRVAFRCEERANFSRLLSCGSGAGLPSDKAKTGNLDSLKADLLTERCDWK